MAYCGVDVGNLTTLVATSVNGGVDVILNDASNRQSATFISINGKQRHIGDAAFALASSHVHSTISGFKMFCGRLYDDPQVQEELRRYPFRSVRTQHGGVGVVLQYGNEEICLTAEHCMAMMLRYAVDIFLKHHSGNQQKNDRTERPPDLVLAVPFWFSDNQRRSLGHACEIAGVNCIRIMNESAAIALSCGYHKAIKGEYHSNPGRPIMIIDMGYTCFTVIIAGFYDDGVKILATYCDPHLGGRNVDDIVVEYCMKQFHSSTGIDLRGNQKATRKLYTAAEKAKKTLSPHGVKEVTINVECIANDRDLCVTLHREEFESRLEPLLNRFQLPIEHCMIEAELHSYELLTEVEIVGGSTRINAIKKRLGKLLRLDPNAVNFGLKTTMNADEAVARGCSLQCAILSGNSKFKPFTIVDRLSHEVEVRTVDLPNGRGSLPPVRLGSSMAVPNTSEARTTLYRRGDVFPQPKSKSVTIRRENLHDFMLVCSSLPITGGGSQPNESPVGQFTIQMPTPVPKELSHRKAPIDVRIKFHIDECSGCLYVIKCEISYEVSGGTFGIIRSTPDKTKKIPLRVIADVPGDMSHKQINDAVAWEGIMQKEDVYLEQIAIRRNELETLLYGLRDNVDQCRNKLPAEDVRSFVQTIDGVEEWLYSVDDMRMEDIDRQFKILQRVSRSIQQPMRR